MLFCMANETTSSSIRVNFTSTSTSLLIQQGTLFVDNNGNYWGVTTNYNTGQNGILYSQTGGVVTQPTSFVSPITGVVVNITSNSYKAGISTIVPAGSEASDINDNYYSLTSNVILSTLGSNGVFNSVNNGVIICLPYSLINIVSSIIGWKSVTNIVAGQIGSNSETFFPALSNLATSIKDIQIGIKGRTLGYTPIQTNLSQLAQFQYLTDISVIMPKKINETSPLLSNILLLPKNNNRPVSTALLNGLSDIQNDIVNKLLKNFEEYYLNTDNLNIYGVYWWCNKLNLELNPNELATQGVKFQFSDINEDNININNLTINYNKNVGLPFPNSSKISLSDNACLFTYTSPASVINFTQLTLPDSMTGVTITSLSMSGNKICIASPNKFWLIPDITAATLTQTNTTITGIVNIGINNGYYGYGILNNIFIGNLNDFSLIVNGSGGWGSNIKLFSNPSTLDFAILTDEYYQYTFPYSSEVPHYNTYDSGANKYNIPISVGQSAKFGCFANNRYFIVTTGNAFWASSDLGTAAAPTPSANITWSQLSLPASVLSVISISGNSTTICAIASTIPDSISGNLYVGKISGNTITWILFGNPNIPSLKFVTQDNSILVSDGVNIWNVTQSAQQNINFIIKL